MAGVEAPPGEAATAPIRIADRTWLLAVRDPSRPGIALPLMVAAVGPALAAMLCARARETDVVARLAATSSPSSCPVAT